MLGQVVQDKKRAQFTDRSGSWYGRTPDPCLQVHVACVSSIKMIRCNQALTCWVPQRETGVRVGEQGTFEALVGGLPILMAPITRKIVLNTWVCPTLHGCRTHGSGKEHHDHKEVTNVDLTVGGRGPASERRGNKKTVSCSDFAGNDTTFRLRIDHM